jgi:hypothetical protein
MRRRIWHPAPVRLVDLDRVHVRVHIRQHQVGGDCDVNHFLDKVRPRLRQSGPLHGVGSALLVKRARD